jgi:2-dehydro-3-deoxyphosphogluconate aldolase/(4S)-4-hydroxy-2-oxoglutarate aldolase
MKNTQQILNAITNQGVLPLYFNADETVSKEVLKAIYKAGIKAVEYTNRGETALGNFESLVALRNQEMPDMLLGIGTIKNLDQAIAYLNVGADFLLSPGFVAEVAKHCVEKDIFYSPGCMTPTEIIAAETAGLKFIKLFPGNILKTDFLMAIKDIFPDLYFMPTGGVDTTEENISSWYKAGVSAVGMGSKLISKELMASQDYKTIENNTKEVLQIIKNIQK